MNKEQIKQEAESFLKKKGLLRDDKTEFVIYSNDFGTVNLSDLLNEYAVQSKIDLLESTVNGILKDIDFNDENTEKFYQILMNNTVNKLNNLKQVKTEIEKL